MPTPQTLDQYIASVPKQAQEKLKELRQLVKELVPEAGEKVSYGIGTFTLKDKYFIYIAGYKDHISLHPMTADLEEAIPEVKKYKTGKGTAQFPLDQPLPIPLIRKIIQFRAQARKKT